MSHTDPDDLAMVALGELALDAEQAQHLSECALCAQELAALEQTVGAVRRAPAEQLATPDPRVWEAVAREVRASGPLEDTPVRHVAPRGRGSRARSRLILLAGGLVSAAVAVLLVVLVVVPRPVDIATAVLDAFPDHPGATGTAALEREPNGSERVVVNLDADVSTDGHREVWLLTEDGSALVSLGILEGDSGTFEVPAEVDTSLYRVVDISQEPDDGDLAHSGDSIVRGSLQPS